MMDRGGVSTGNFGGGVQLNLRQLVPSRLGLTLGFALVIGLVAMVAAASAAPNVDLIDPDVRLSDNFYPCPLQTDFTRPPQVNECLDASNSPLRPLVIDAGQTSCAPNGTSTIHVHRTTGFASTPSVPGPGWASGTVTWDLTATLGDQTAGAVMPNIQPFPDDGARMDSAGFHTGQLTSLVGTFTIDLDNSTESITGEVTLVSNDGNWGVCRGPFTNEVTGSQTYGGAPLTGSFVIINAGVLAYRVTAGPAALLGEEGIAEAYFSNEFATCCNAAAPTGINAATGHFRQQFGTTHAAAGSSGSATTDPSGSNPVTVSNFVGLDQEVGGVSVTFPTVTTAGATTAIVMTSLSGLGNPTFQVGDPPALYEISTTAEHTFPVTVCLPYGSLPAGVPPRIFHYENGEWADKTILPVSTFPEIVCGNVDSFSPFAVGYYTYTVSGPFQPVDQAPTLNVMKAGRTVPVKFALGGDHGLSVFAAGFPGSQNITCDGATPTDAVETTTANPSGLTYDAASGAYSYNWKTLTTWKGQCRRLTLQFTDGQTLSADFRFN
jgi:hypothetical protein